jgi:SAM-dependent methyltransferase
METYEETLARWMKETGDYEVFAEFRDDAGDHPEGFQDYECQFAADLVRRLNPRAILDVGSYRHFLLGLMAHFPITTIDVRARRSAPAGETPLTCEAASIDLPDRSFDLVLSLCALEHFGLGRYGDRIDFGGDRKVLAEMVRLLSPGGHLILTTTIHNAPPAVAFNAHRIYNAQKIHAMCVGLVPIEERFYSHTLGRFCALEEVTLNPKWWDVYCGCWQRP